MVFQSLFGLKRQPVNPLHLRIFLVAAPISAADFVQLKSVGFDFRCIFHVAAATEVGKFAGFVETDGYSNPLPPFG